jgi:hypothetical protein
MLRRIALGSCGREVDLGLLGTLLLRSSPLERSVNLGHAHRCGSFLRGRPTRCLGSGLTSHDARPDGDLFNNVASAGLISLQVVWGLVLLSVTTAVGVLAAARASQLYRLADGRCFGWQMRMLASRSTTTSGSAAFRALMPMSGKCLGAADVRLRGTRASPPSTRQSDQASSTRASPTSRRQQRRCPRNGRVRRATGLADSGSGRTGRCLRCPEG